MWNVYILQCSDGSFYTGITEDLERRLVHHNAGKASKYTRSRRPVQLIYSEPAENRSAAAIREIKIKKLSRQKKEFLVYNA